MKKTCPWCSERHRKANSICPHCDEPVTETALLKEILKELRLNDE